MARPAHQLVTLSGVFGSAAAPVEQWSFGLRFLQNRWDTGDVALPTAIANAWGTSLAPLFSTSIVLTKVRAASVDATGHVGRLSSGAYMQADWNGQKSGTATQPNPYPPQVAVCVSLVTPRPDATGKGRVFLPQVSYNLNATDYRLGASTAQLVADGFKAFHAAVAAYNPANAGFSGNPGAQVVSSKGYASPVVSFRVGRALDTMRSRRNDLQEGYVQANV